MLVQTSTPKKLTNGSKEKKRKQKDPKKSEQNTIKNNLLQQLVLILALQILVRRLDSVTHHLRQAFDILQRDRELVYINRRETNTHRMLSQSEVE